MATCCNNCKWLSPTGRPGNPERPFCLKNLETSILGTSVLRTHPDPCTEYYDLGRIKAEVKHLIVAVLEALGGYLSKNDLEILDLRTRLSKLEGSPEVGRESDPSQPVVEPPATDSPAVAQKTSIEPPAVEEPVLESPRVRETYKGRVFTSVQKTAAVKILQFLLPRPTDSRNTNFLATQTGLKIGATQTVIKGLISRDLLREVPLGGVKIWYGVPPDRLSEVRAWISESSDELPGDATSVVAQTNTPPSVDSRPLDNSPKSNKPVDPGPGAPVANLQKIHNLPTLTYPDGKYKQATSHNPYDLKRSAWRRGYTVVELPEKRAEIAYIHRGRRNRASR